MRFESADLSLQINPGKEECFWEQVEANQPLRMEFEVTRGGMLDVRLKLYDPFENKVVERMAFFNQPNPADNDAAGRIEYLAKTTGVHKICFDNTMSKWTPKVVSFAMVDSDAGKVDVAKLEHLGPVVDSVIRLGDMLETMEDTQHHLRVRLQYHTDRLSTNFFLTHTHTPCFLTHHSLNPQLPSRTAAALNGLRSSS